VFVTWTKKTCHQAKNDRIKHWLVCTYAARNSGIHTYANLEYRKKLITNGSPLLNILATSSKIVNTQITLGCRAVFLSFFNFRNIGIYFTCTDVSFYAI
jgi:hypothetical protein